jgi:hypothetical protein
MVEEGCISSGCSGCSSCFTGCLSVAFWTIVIVGLMVIGVLALCDII